MMVIAHKYQFLGTSISAVMGLLLSSGTLLGFNPSELIRFSLAGTIADGGTFGGTFAIDPSAPDTILSSGLGFFELTEINIRIKNTTLFASSGLPPLDGIVTEGLLRQSSFTGTQALHFNAVSAANGGAFSQINFGPFTGNSDIASAIEGSFIDGYWDGNGQPEITSLSLSIVPEPSSLAMLTVLVVSLLPQVRI